MYRLVILILSLLLAFGLSLILLNIVGIIMEKISGEIFGVGAWGFFYPTIITTIILTILIYIVLNRLRS